MRKHVPSPVLINVTSSPAITSSNAAVASGPRGVATFTRTHPLRGAATGLVVLCLAGLAACPTWGQEFTPFVIPARIDPNQAIWVADYKPIAVDSERLEAHGGHFYRGGPIRIWGVNLCFGANFPTHEDAPLVATRLAAAGVNSVRLHHMDTARWPGGIWNAQDGKTIEPKALDRLDYFINELANRGIFINVNLHVGYKHSEALGLPATNREFDKICGIFAPALIDAQKKYAKDILTHVNPYRKVRYADDPAVAFVEITNEDSFFMWDGEETLRTLPPYYAGILRGRFNAWLSKRYGSDEALAAAWGKDVEPLSQDMVNNGRFIAWDAGGGTPKHWNLEQHEQCQATLSHPQNLPRDAMQIDVAKSDETQWHLQLTQGGLKINAGRYYTLSFEATAGKNRQIGCVVSQAHEPWANLGFSRSVELGTDWQTFRFGFVATGEDDNARISFAFSGDPTSFQLAHVELHPGGQVGLAEGESTKAGSVELFRDCESPVRIVDRMIFLAETEKAYFDGMRSYIRNDLGCGALVTGTIVFGPLGLYAQSGMDYIDSHSYWQHPSFPGRAWDSNNWLIQQRPMTDYPEQATLFRIAAERLAGKPFTLSEYNHPAPLDSQAECVPMVASFAAAQDWDGIWLFTYSHATDDWARETMSGFFDMDTNPAKWGFMRAGAAIFRDRAVRPLGTVKVLRVAGLPAEVGTLARFYSQYGSSMLNVLTGACGIAYQDMLKTRIIPNYENVAAGLSGRNSTSMTWDADSDGKGFYSVVSPQAKVYTGHAGRFEDGTKGAVRLTSPELATFAITSLDDGSKILITSCGRCENAGMQFSADRRTVGRNWGGAPVQIETVKGTVVLPEGKWICHALTPDGKPKQEVRVTYQNGQATLAMSPEYATMWYLLERQSRQ